MLSNYENLYLIPCILEYLPKKAFLKDAEVAKLNIKNLENTSRVRYATLNFYLNSES